MKVQVQKIKPTSEATNQIVSIFQSPFTLLSQFSSLNCKDMNENYQLGPVAISKSFVQNPLLLPAVMGVIVLVVVGGAIKTGRLSLSGKPSKPTVMAKVFPLEQRLSKPLLYSSGTTIYRTDGHSEEKMFEVGSEVLRLAISNDGSKLAAVYKSPQGGLSSSGFQNTSLIYYDMNTRRSLPLIAKENTTVDFPQWSDDNRYVSFTVNDGEESFIYDTNRKKAIYSVKKEGSTPVSPIIFTPGTTGIMYVKNNTVYSAAIDGSRAIALAEQANSRLTIESGATKTTAPILSPNGSYFMYTTLNNELRVVNTATRELKTIGSDLTNSTFLNDESLLYESPGKSDNEDSTIYRYSIADEKSTRIRTQGNLLPLGALPIHTQGQFYLHSTDPNLGPQLLSNEGNIVRDCSTADFSYQYDSTNFSQNTTVVSSDGKYLLGTSEKSVAVLDTATCQPYIISQSKATATTWIP